MAHRSSIVGRRKKECLLFLSVSPQTDGRKEERNVRHELISVGSDGCPNPTESSSGLTFLASFLPSVCGETERKRKQFCPSTEKTRRWARGLIFVHVLSWFRRQISFSYIFICRIILKFICKTCFCLVLRKILLNQPGTS